MINREILNILDGANRRPIYDIERDRTASTTTTLPTAI